MLCSCSCECSVESVLYVRLGLFALLAKYCAFVGILHVFLWSLSSACRSWPTVCLLFFFFLGGGLGGEGTVMTQRYSTVSCTETPSVLTFSLIVLDKRIVTVVLCPHSGQTRLCCDIK